MSMKYSADVLNQAEQILSERKKAAESEQRSREEYVFSNIPEAAMLQKRISSRYYSLIRLVANHDADAREKAEKLRLETQQDQQRIKLLVKDLTGEEDYLKTRYTCDKCQDTGFCEGKRCGCMEELLKKLAVEELNKNSTILLHSFDEFKDECYDDPSVRERMRRVKSALCEYCENFPVNNKSLLFIGRTGLGKTFFSSCVASALAERGFAVAIGSVSDLLRSVENDHFGRSENNTMELLLQADMLIIDDLGTEFRSPFNESTVYSLLNGRMNQNKKTIISTNMTVEQINERYNERIASRIIGGFMPLIFQGSDLRQKGL